MIYVHGNQTTHWSLGWASWVKAQLDAMAIETFFETMPDSIIARSEYWLPFLRDHVKVTAEDVVLGWSSGAVAALRLAEETELKGSVLVAPCYTDLGDEMERASGYFDGPWDWPSIRAHQQHIELLSAVDDPYIPQAEFKTIAESVGAAWTNLPEGGHFIEQETFPEVIEAVRRVVSL